MSDQGKLEKDAERYRRAAHRIQSAIAFDPDKTSQTPKHLRVGVDLRASDAAGLAELLISKGIITREEYFAAIADAAEREAESREHDLSAKYGVNVKTF